MRVLRVEGPGTDPRIAEAIGAAVVAFNGALDIRLRFLAIGIEETVLAAGEPHAAPEAVARSLSSAPFEAVVLLGDPEVAHACAAAADRAGVPVVRVGAGLRSGGAADASRAVDRIARALVALDDAAAEALRGEGFSPSEEPRGDDPAAAGERVVRALTRVRRISPC